MQIYKIKNRTPSFQNDKIKFWLQAAYCFRISLKFDLQYAALNASNKYMYIMQLKKKFRSAAGIHVHCIAFPSLFIAFICITLLIVRNNHFIIS